MFRELDASLPNGFHDAELQSFQMDYLDLRLTFDLVLWIAELDGPRELYRPARLTFDEVRFLFVEAPRNRDDAAIAGSLKIDAGEGIPDGVNCGPVSEADAAAMVWVYLNDFNSFIVFSASRGSLEWRGEAEDLTETLKP